MKRASKAADCTCKFKSSILSENKEIVSLKAKKSYVSMVPVHDADLYAKVDWYPELSKLSCKILT